MDPKIVVVATNDELIFWIGITLAGLIIVARNASDAITRYQQVKKSGLNGGYLIMAYTHAWEGVAQTTKMLCFTAAGIAAAIGLRMLPFFLMFIGVVIVVVNSVQFRRYRDRAIKAEAKYRK